MIMSLDTKILTVSSPGSRQTRIAHIIDDGY